MSLGYVRSATYTPEIKVGDVDFNLSQIKSGIDLGEEKGVHILAFPELCLTGCTAGDLFYQNTLISAVKNALEDIAEYSKGKNMVVFVGAPIKNGALTYNCSVAISNGVILGVVPKSYLNDSENKYFAVANDKVDYLKFNHAKTENGLVCFGKNVIFSNEKDCELKLAVEIGEDLFGVIPPSTFHAVSGAKIIINNSAVAEFSLEGKRIVNSIKEHSKKSACAYLYCNAGKGESTTDCVYSGHNVICENGEILSQNAPFENGLIYADVDVENIDYIRNKTFKQDFSVYQKEYVTVDFCLDTQSFVSDRAYKKTPFINYGEEELLLAIQANGLAKRLSHTNANRVVLGLSGGLDSTLALIVSVKAIKMLNRPVKDVLAITMPCFGTSSRTLENSIKLAKAYGVTLKKIDITKSVTRHLKDIGHALDVHDPAYENAQARERTQVLMDIANMNNGLVVGTGDLSELALGWATYNGDHMSMYAVNASVPKTLVRHLTEYTAKNSKGKLKAVLLDILDTPVSPELIPAENDKIKQVTEDIVGPYILHDFFLYMMLKHGFSPRKIYAVALNTFDEFDDKTILKWLKTFIRRFFNQQFKRSCMPDGVKVSEISLSPRGSFNMPSDAVSKLWLEQLENL